MSWPSLHVGAVLPAIDAEQGAEIGTREFAAVLALPLIRDVRVPTMGCDPHVDELMFAVLAMDNESVIGCRCGDGLEWDGNTDPDG